LAHLTFYCFHLARPQKVCPSLVYYNEITPRYIAEGSHLHTRSRQNLKAHIFRVCNEIGLTGLEVSVTSEAQGHMQELNKISILSTALQIWSVSYNLSSDLWEWRH
jgi:hypothetical protein